MPPIRVVLSLGAPRKINIETPWAKYIQVSRMAAGQYWARWCGADGLYRWLHPTENRWVEEPEQIGMPNFPSYKAAFEAEMVSPEPPTWEEFRMMPDAERLM